jgi:hypothetical protein
VAPSTTLENYTVATLQIFGSEESDITDHPEGWFDHHQDIKGTWWMPWHQEAMKDVNGCDKPRGSAE